MDGLSEKEKENDANYAKHSPRAGPWLLSKKFEVEPSTASIPRI